MQAEQVEERREHHPALPRRMPCSPSIPRGAAPWGWGSQQLGTALALTSLQALGSSVTLRCSVPSFMLPPLAGEPQG